MLSNAHFLAKFRFDTAENEPAKNLQILLTLLTVTLSRHLLRRRADGQRPGRVAERAERALGEALLYLISIFYGEDTPKKGEDVEKK